MFCKHCGKEIDGRAEICPYCGVSTKKQGKFCAYCGNEIGEETFVCPYCGIRIEEKTNGLGIAGFVLSLVSLAFMYMAVLQVIAFVFAVIAVGGRKKYCRANGLAVAGLVISCISICISIALCSIFFILFSHNYNP